jgi:hypothetical protein
MHSMFVYGQGGMIETIRLGDLSKRFCQVSVEWPAILQTWIFRHDLLIHFELNGSWTWVVLWDFVCSEVDFPSNFDAQQTHNSISDEWSMN